MKIFVLDTSIIVSFLDPRDKVHNQARERLLSLPHGAKFIIPFTVLAELVIGTLHLDEIYEFCSILTESFEYNTQHDIEFISHLDGQKRRSLKTNDCLILSICKRHNAELITLDRKLERYSREIL